MKLIVSKVFLLFVCISSYAQYDTLYVEFSYNGPDQVLTGFKHKNDTSKNYPFDGGRIYIFRKKVGNFTEDFRLFFRSYTPAWMEEQFEYYVVDTAILQKKDFKNRKWFDKNEYIEILEILNNADLIYLIDKNYIKNGKAYMVRVYFNHTADE